MPDESMTLREHLELIHRERQRALEIAKEIIEVRIISIESAQNASLLRIENLERSRAWVIGGMAAIGFMFTALNVVISYFAKKD